MREQMTRAALSVASGVVRSIAFAAVALIIPVVAGLIPGLAAMHLLGRPWSWTNPWSWIGLVLIVVPVSLGLAHSVGVLSRSLLARWSALRLPTGYREQPEPVRLSTGFWWNGASYERTREDAQSDLRVRRVLEPAYWREVRWAMIAAVTLAPVCGACGAAVVCAAILFTHPSPLSIASGLVLLVAAAVIAPFAWRTARPLARRWLAAPSRLAPPTAGLRVQRADLSAAHDAEIRRIERDLHDGAQSRLVAVGLDLATAEHFLDTDPERARALLRAARTGTAESLSELRELVHGVYPPVLIERGLVPALRAVALDSPVGVTVDAPGELRLPSPLEAAVYFGVSELLTNIAAHAGASKARITVQADAGKVELAVRDNGSGGALVRPDGGLAGIRRRLAAFGGTLEIDSPEGGPTSVIMRVPCESS